jgi:hypothetical protein
MIFWWIALIVFAGWLLVDRHLHNKKILESYLSALEELEKSQNEYRNLLDKKWDIMLLDAAQQDGDDLVRDLYHLNPKQGLTVAALNREFEKAKMDFAQAFKNHQPLRPKVARIINLLQLDSYNREYVAKQNQKHLN